MQGLPYLFQPCYHMRWFLHCLNYLSVLECSGTTFVCYCTILHMARKPGLHGSQSASFLNLSTSCLNLYCACYFLKQVTWKSSGRNKAVLFALNIQFKEAFFSITPHERSQIQVIQKNWHRTQPYCCCNAAVGTLSTSQGQVLSTLELNRWLIGITVFTISSCFYYFIMFFISFCLPPGIVVLSLGGQNKNVNKHSNFPISYLRMRDT